MLHHIGVEIDVSSLASGVCLTLQKGLGVSGRKLHHPAVGQEPQAGLCQSAMFSGSGIVQQTSIKANMWPTATLTNEARCNHGRALILTATVDSNVNPQFLAGVLSVADCPDSDRVHFHAVREDQSKAKEGN